MSQKQKRFFGLSLVLPLILLICVVFCLQQNSESAVKQKNDPGLLAKIRNSFEEYIEDDVFFNMRKAFESGRFDKFGGEIADRTVMYSPDGTRYSGQVEIEKYFKELHKKGVTDIIFLRKHEEVFLVEEPIENKEKTIDAIGFAIWTYSLVMSEDGEIIDIDDPAGETDSRHHRSCEWEPEGGI